MHEFSMATQLVESVIEEAKRHDAKKVAEVHLSYRQVNVSWSRTNALLL